MSARSWSVIALISSAAACAHHAAVPADHPEERADPPIDHWEIVTDRRFISPEPCGTGPYEIAFPAREIGFGRRTVVMVYGARVLELDNRIDSDRMSSGIAMSQVTEGDHSRCRSDGAEVAATPSSTPLGNGSSVATHPPAGGTLGHTPRSGYDTPASELPALVEYDGVLPNVRQQAGAIAWLPGGNPFYYADEYWTTRLTDDTGAAGYRFRFWFAKPSDLRGLVFRFVDERLVPDLPLDRYRAEYARRVASAEARREARRPVDAEKAKHLTRRCELFPDDGECVARRRVHGRIPPAPRAEVRPQAPSAEVDWAPGYWSWSDEADDFLWIAGTFIVRPPPVVAQVTPPPAPAPAPAPEPVAPRPIPQEITEVPAPRSEVIVAPPPLPGAIWVAGHWQLVGARWAWIAGTWLVPPRGTVRFVTPSIRVRGALRVYLPGRWIRR